MLARPARRRMPRLHRVIHTLQDAPRSSLVTDECRPLSLVPILAPSLPGCFSDRTPVPPIPLPNP
jgi:hypothetical protein